MIDPRHLRAEVIRPTLHHLGLHSPAAEDLLLGTALQESDGGRWLRQLGDGPALGPWQMEPATCRDIWDHYLRYRSDLARRVEALMCPGQDEVAQLVGNLPYACAMARVHYLRIPAPLPPHGDVRGYAHYWKAYYNTHLGRGTEAEFLGRWNRAGSAALDV